jgi:hypothetical protein
VTDDLSAKAAIEFRNKREREEALRAQREPQRKPHASQQPVELNGNEAPTYSERSQMKDPDDAPRNGRIVREAAAKCNKQKIASAIASAKTVAAVERLSKSDRLLAATEDQWDDHPTILNTPRKDTDQ